MKSKYMAVLCIFCILLGILFLASTGSSQGFLDIAIMFGIGGSIMLKLEKMDK